MLKIGTYRRAYGQYFTPESLVAGCYALLADHLPASPRIVDPACGDGAFLRYAAAQGLAAPQDLYGCDVDSALAEALAAAGLPHVRHADGLDPASLPDAAFDLVVGNPPFGVATAPGAGQPLASEVRFLLRAVELAQPGGSIALVLPSGVLANERLRAIRADLLNRCTLLAVIALPRAAFRHTGTTAACSILLLRNAPAPPQHQAFFALAQDLAELPAIVEAYRAVKNQEPRTENRVPSRRTKNKEQRTNADQGQKNQEPRTENRVPSRRTKNKEQTPTSGTRQRTTDNGQLTTDNGQLTTDNGQLTSFWLPQTAALAQRMDPHFWRPDFRLLLESMAARHPLRPLGELIGRDGLIVGDHVRPSRGESKGPGLAYEYYQTREFLPAGYNYTTLERCDERAYQRLARSAVQQHDILVSCAGVGGAGQGRVCLVTHQPGLSCTGDIFILRTARPDPRFLFLFLSSLGGRAQLLRLQNGVGTVNLSADELLQVQVPLLPPSLEHDFAARYTPIAAAHDLAMAALARGDTTAFAQQRGRAEELLAQLRYELENVVLRLEIGD